VIRLQQININNNDKNDNKFSIDTIKNLIMIEYKRITIMVTIAVILTIAFAAITSIFSKSEAKAIAEYSKYQSDILADKANDNDDNVKTVIIPSDTVVNVNKINSDISSAEKYISTWFDWTNGDEYDVARQNVLDTFGEDSIMSSIFVENARTASGNSYVDNFKVNMVINSIKTYPTVINKNDNNEYLSMISVSTNTGNSSMKYILTITYAYDENSNIVDAHVFLNTK